MSKEYKAKVFKSGNSMALRLPKALGIKEGSEMVLREISMGYAFEPMTGQKRKLDVSSFWGKAPGIEPPLREDFEERPSAIAARARKPAA